MYQYDDPTVTANLPVSTAAGTAGYFTDGNPAGGQPATILRAEFMNMLMMELVNAIAGAGITPSKSTFTQLKEAIEAYITARAASSSDAGIVALSTNAETQDGELSTVAVTPASLASRTATETRTGLVELATNAEARAFTANKVIDGEKLAEAFGGANQGFTTSGYQKLPGGLIIQWGTTNNTSVNPLTVTLPVSFPNQGLVAVASDLSGSFLPTTSIMICSARFLSNSQIQTATASAPNTMMADSLQWIAIGY